jgi:uncharacterized protein YgiB involved in biofilm formation
MKRSKRLTLTSLMAGSSLSLGACGGDAASPAVQWGNDTPAASASASADAVEARDYATVDECKAAGDFAPAECDKAYAAAQADAEANGPRFSDQQSCEERYGVDQCVPRNQAGGGSFFTPLLTGFLVGQALGGGGGFFGRPYYRDRYGDSYLGNGRRLDRNYVNGRYQIGRDQFGPPRAQAPARVQSRSAVVSRGGFGGGGGRSYGG